MKPRVGRRAFWIFAGASAVGCALELDADGEGKACGGSGQCAAGYSCNDQGRCVRSSSADRSAAGASGAAGEPDAAATPGGGAGTATGDGGTDSGAGGQAGAFEDSGATEDGCASPVRYFADDDKDGVGRGDTTRWACTPPAGAWATRGNDCDDSNPAVFPGQTRYFEAGFARGSNESFDYDCSGSEDPDPALPGRAPDCTALGVTNYNGSGSPPRDEPATASIQSAAAPSESSAPSAF